MIDQCEKELKMIKMKNKKTKIELKKNGDFLEKVVNSVKTTNYIQKYLRDSQINLNKINQYKEKIKEVEFKIEERLRELEDIELVEKTLY